ncbi:uncharacterized mitochondrial protein AtMg00820-like [Lactuca sativa]|uniref:uncharacterized mitochondrial protein AtMg00820-like n=1 Tax=Lactuca sativa TaxID=4236 RepID=UPI000CD8E07A|nr:uncharacterized mitochondrial protein AtMg00820-like [Lactuca sativa]
MKTVIESRDAIFDEERFTSIPRPRDMIQQSSNKNLPSACKAFGCKWILKWKMKVDGLIDKYKAKLVIHGFRQKEEIDFFDIYAPIAGISTSILMLALTTIHNLVIHQMDVKNYILEWGLG